MKGFKTTILLLFSLVVVNLWWRWESRRLSLLCPTWLAGGLESPLMDKLIGTQAMLDCIGLQPRQRVLAVGPRLSRLLIPAAKR